MHAGTILALFLVAAAPARPPVRWSHLFGLYTATEAAESTWAALTYDRRHDELLVVQEGTVRVFNAAGMETYGFGGDDGFVFFSVAVLDDGSIVAIGSSEGRPPGIVRCDFRGERLGAFELRGLSAAFADFRPDTVVHHEARLYFADRAAMRVVVTDLAGAVLHALDLAAVTKVGAKGKAEGGMTGFGVAADGKVLFTMPTLFTVYVVSLGGEVRAFGTRGSTPGKFNNVGGITTDERGTIFLTDRLRSVVMVFDRDLAFRGEFGYRGDGEANLVAPFDLAVGNGKIYVAQAGNRGVSVFKYELE
jgi:hypothetical protein